jgi:hypothetical protein
MNSHGHSFLSIFSGAFLSIFTYIAENPLSDLQQFFKVVLWGLIGGASGYLGKLIIIQIIKYFRK